MRYGERIGTCGMERRMDWPFDRNLAFPRFENFSRRLQNENIVGLGCGSVRAHARRKKHALATGIISAHMPENADEPLHSKDTCRSCEFFP